MLCAALPSTALLRSVSRDQGESGYISMGDDAGSDSSAGVAVAVAEAAAVAVAVTVAAEEPARVTFAAASASSLCHKDRGRG